MKKYLIFLFLYCCFIEVSYGFCPEDSLQLKYLQPIITQYFIDNKSEIWLLFLIAHSKR